MKRGKKKDKKTDYERTIPRVIKAYRRGLGLVHFMRETHIVFTVFHSRSCVCIHPFILHNDAM